MESFSTKMPSITRGAVTVQGEWVRKQDGLMTTMGQRDNLLEYVPTRNRPRWK